MKLFLTILLLNIVFLVESNKLIRKYKFDSKIIHKMYNNKRGLSDNSESSSNVVTDSSSESSSNVVTDSSSESSSNVAIDSSSESSSNVAIDSSSESSSNVAIDSSSESSSNVVSDSSSNVPSEQSDQILPGKILLGYDHYTYSSQKLSFFSYIRNVIEQAKNNFNIMLRITRNFRLLEENITNQEASCKYEGSDNNTDKYNCSVDNIEGPISKVEVINLDNNIKKSNLAEAMGKNLQYYATGDKSLQQKIISISDCKIEESSNELINITGKNNSLLNNGELTLYVVQEGNQYIIEVPSTLNHLNKNTVQMLLRPKRSINADLDGTLGKMKGGNNVYLTFQSSNSTENYLEYKAPINNLYRKKSSGLSTGGIIAIIIPCTLVLLAVAAVAFMMGRKKQEPLTQNITNTAGINSSANIVN
jgi:hypothetical protein